MEIKKIWSTPTLTTFGAIEDLTAGRNRNRNRTPVVKWPGFYDGVILANTTNIGVPS